MIYWSVMEALNHHPDFFDIQENNLNRMINFQNLYGFPLLRFLRDHTQKTLSNTPDLWVVLRRSGVDKVCFCGAHQSDCMAPDCCYTSSDGRRICTGPQRTNFSYWLYQNDNLSGGKTVVFYVPESNLSSQIKSHAYGNLSARRTDQSTNNPYMYFDVEDQYQPPADKKGWEITVTLANTGTDKLSLEYINKSGQTQKKTIIKGQGIGSMDSWIDYKWTLTDANFFGNKMNGADFRINSENDGDETIHRVIVKPITVPATPTPTHSPSRSPSPTLSLSPSLSFYPGWQQVTLQNNSQIPSNCQVITYKTNNVWQNFLTYLGNLPFAPRKTKVWVKCN
jgi:hypothetical protein